MKIPVIGNGDVDSPQKAKQMFDEYGVDGIMIGRAAIGNPWIFNQVRTYLDSGILMGAPELQERVSACKIHLLNSVALKGERRAVPEMRKHYSGYFRSLPHFKNYRLKLLLSQSLEEVLSLLDLISQQR